MDIQCTNFTDIDVSFFSHRLTGIYVEHSLTTLLV